MKKIISLILTAVLALSVFSVSAFANEVETGKPEPTAGPSGEPYLYGGARVGVSNPSTHKNTYVVNYDYSGGGLDIRNDAITGMTYDKTTNTLTIADVHKKSEELFVWYMGNDFKLNVVGENEFGVIYVYNALGFYNTSLNIVGSGTLTVNEQLENESAVNMISEGESPIMGLDIADTVTVNLYSQKNDSGEGEENYPVAALSATAVAPADGGAITVGGKSAPEVKNRRISVEESEMVPVIEVIDRNENFSHGLRVKSKTDPTGVYALSDIMDGVVYLVQRYIYVSDLRMWIVDHSYTDSGFLGKRYTKAEFEAEYDYVYGMAPVKVKYMETYKQDFRGTEGHKLTKDGEAGSVYIGLPTGGTWDWGEDDDYTGNYQIIRAAWDEKQGMYVEDPGFEAVDLMAGELEENGYHFVTETFDELLQLSVWTSDDQSDSTRFELTNNALRRVSDPDGLYIQVGTYSSGDGEEGISVHKVHYNPDTDEHYILYNSYSSSEYFLVSDADLQSGKSDFFYDSETVTRHVRERYLPADYKIDWDLVDAVQIKKESEPDAVYAYKQWKHFSQGTETDKYAIIKIVYNEDLGCYIQDSGFEEYEIYDPDMLDMMGYEVVKANQPIEYVTKGTIDLYEMPVYTDNNGKKYYADHEGNVYSFNDEDVITLGGITYHYGTYMSGLGVDELNDTVSEVETDNYSYWISGPEYHHKGEEAEHIEYPIWVNGEQITSDRLMIPCGEGSAVYNPASNTLTLSNAEITKGAEKDWTYSGVLSQMDQLNIVIMGECIISGTGGDGIGTYNSESYQIGDVYYTAPYDLTICGDGTLTISESTPVYGYGLYCTGNLVIDGVTLNIDSAAAGVWASNLEIKNTEAHIRTSSWYSGIVVNRGNLTFENSTVEAESAEGSGLLLGNDVDVSALTVNSGELKLGGKIGVQGPVDNSVVKVNGGRLEINATEAAFDETFLKDNAKCIVMGEGIGVTSGSLDSKSVVIEETGFGHTVNVDVESFGSEDDEITVTVKNGEGAAVKDASAKGNSARLTLSGIADGDYTVTVSKKNHVARDYALTVSGDTTLTTKIHLLGDVNGDGELTTMDYAKVNAAAKGARQITDEYIKKVADVVADGEITTMDATRINAAAKGARPLW